MNIEEFLNESLNIKDSFKEDISEDKELIIQMRTAKEALPDIEDDIAWYNSKYPLDFTKNDNFVFIKGKEEDLQKFKDYYHLDDYTESEVELKDSVKDKIVEEPVEENVAAIAADPEILNTIGAAMTIKDAMEEELNEKVWKKEVPKDLALKFRKAINSESETMRDAIEATNLLLNWILEQYPDRDYEVEEIKDNMQMIEIDGRPDADFGEYDEEEEVYETNEDYFNTCVLNPLYDLCDELDIWIPTEALIDESKDKETTKEDRTSIKERLDDNQEEVDEVIEDFLEFLADHETAKQDFVNFFHLSLDENDEVVGIEKVHVVDIIDWIMDHPQLAADFEAFIGYDLKESKDKKSLKEKVNWDYYNKFKDIEDKYLPRTGEGDTKASQIVTAVTKLVYKWYNDGDVFDNTYGLEGWANDLSSYANWLYKYVPETRSVLDRIQDIYNEDGYEQLLKHLTDLTHSQEFLDKYDQPFEGTIYECDGPFEFTWHDEDTYDESLKESKYDHLINSYYVVDCDDEIKGQFLDREETKNLVKELKNTAKDYIYVTRNAEYEGDEGRVPDFEDIVNVEKQDNNWKIFVDKFNIFENDLTEKTISPISEGIEKDMYFVKTNEGYVSENMDFNSGKANMLFVKTPDRAKVFYNLMDAKNFAKKLNIPFQIEYSNDFGDSVKVVVDFKNNLTEKNWKNQLPKDIALKFRQAINSDDIKMKEIVEATNSVLDYILKEYPDSDYEVEEIKDNIQMISLDDYVDADFAEYEDEEGYYQSNADYFNEEVLNPLYDLCDNLDLWIPTEALIDESLNEENIDTQYKVIGYEYSLGKNGPRGRKHIAFKKIVYNEEEAIKLANEVAKRLSDVYGLNYVEVYNNEELVYDTHGEYDPNIKPNFDDLNEQQIMDSEDYIIEALLKNEIKYDQDGNKFYFTTEDDLIKAEEIICQVVGDKYTKNTQNLTIEVDFDNLEEDIAKKATSTNNKEEIKKEIAELEKERIELEKEIDNNDNNPNYNLVETHKILKEIDEKIAKLKEEIGE